jgi:hypothetical protein
VDPDEPRSREMRVGLEKIVRRRRAFWAVFVLLLPGSCVVERVTASARVSTVFFVFGVMLWMTLAIAVRFSRCPRCSKFYHITESVAVHDFFARRCKNCGLSLTGQE